MSDLFSRAVRGASIRVVVKDFLGTPFNLNKALSFAVIPALGSVASLSPSCASSLASIVLAREGRDWKTGESEAVPIFNLV